VFEIGEGRPGAFHWRRGGCGTESGSKPTGTRRPRQSVNRRLYAQVAASQTVSHIG
jgi:hypothetical protein